MDPDEYRIRREERYERRNALKESIWKVKMDNIGSDREDVEGVLAANKKRDMPDGHDEECGVLEEGVEVMEEEGRN